jgi:hypothetical protein
LLYFICYVLNIEIKLWEKEGLERERKEKKNGHDTYEEGKMKPNAEEVKIYNIKINNKIRNNGRKAHTK